ncbi:hypothetical protein C1645_838710 [Glomus cerebriforme]|uniref:Uncharacterized protein n=1 Tax=Glomus cerebriforme TaxID=658196 RepID=A0A397S389_9GLOM|nr:hypothetical protein C1645_838710 [Glomus cerebriforme]
MSRKELYTESEIKEFKGKEWFSNVVVTPVEDQEIQYGSDEDAWYGKGYPKSYTNSHLFADMTLNN